MTSLFHVIFVLIWALLTGAESKNEPVNVHSDEFDVKPGGVEHTVEDQLGPFKCIFTYKAQGGTNEKWDITLSLGETGADFVCTIERPGGHSYLFFQEFSLEVTGVTIEDVVIEGDKDSPLQPEEYNVVDNKVQQVDGKFKSQLSRILVYGMKQRHPDL